jgi:hypothetical protein
MGPSQCIHYVSNTLGVIYPWRHPEQSEGSVGHSGRMLRVSPSVLSWLIADRRRLLKTAPAPPSSEFPQFVPSELGLD